MKWDVTSTITCVVACAALWVSWRTERRVRKTVEIEKRIDLYEPRLKVWNAFKALMLEYFTSGFVSKESIDKANASFQAASFIFNDEVRAFLKDLSQNMSAHSLIKNRRLTPVALCKIDNLTDAQRVKEDSDLENLEKCLNAQAVKGRELFERHMSINE
jgi:hypothetical protein